MSKRRLRKGEKTWKQNSLQIEEFFDKNSNFSTHEKIVSIQNLLGYLVDLSFALYSILYLLCTIYISMVFNQGAVMQPVQSSPLNMYTTTTTSDNNNVLMPTKKITMQNQDPFGSLLWKSRDAHVVALISPYTQISATLHLLPSVFSIFAALRCALLLKPYFTYVTRIVLEPKSFLFTLQAHPFFWWQIASILLWLRCEE